MEVVEVEDIQSSLVVPRVMNSLRHTRSEENLTVNNFNNHVDGEEPSDNWSQEDDDISQEVINQPDTTYYIYYNHTQVMILVNVLIYNVCVTKKTQTYII